MLQPGSRLGRYEIRSLLGAGGMGEVYLAHDTQLRRPVALKVLAASVRQDEELRHRLEYEARAASALNHPNILTVYDVGHVGDDHFIATEYVDGVTLRQRMLRVAPGFTEVLDVAIQIVSALAAAEAAGLVHRDVKPDNIMMRGDGYVKLLDFGLARTRGNISETALQKTDPYVVRGTVFYMSPEQLRGLPLDTRSDIWSTGVVMYELISGRLPFDGDAATDVVAAILKSEPSSLTTQTQGPVPPRLVEIVNRALQKDRAHRYQTAGELLIDLQRLRADLERDASSVAGTKEARHATTENVDIADAPPSNLPAQMTGLVGREAERNEVMDLLRRDEVRLVTLTGPGGTGKTRLSLAVGHELLRTVDDGVWVVQLAPLSNAELVVSEIAAVLEVSEGSTSLMDGIRKTLRDKTMLLILDNFEQVLDAAPVVSEILAAAPRVKALVTSRSPLRINGEREYAVPPLTTPPLDLPMAPEAIGAYGSVALFMERATAMKSDFALTPENAAAVAELCVRLDGLPLAIELAAARIKLLPPQAMLARVDNDRLKLLSGGRRDLPERQQTMRAAISWGYNLLGEEEKRLFATLSVFRGGFSMEMAEALSDDCYDVLEGLSSLVDKAFLRRDAASTDEAPRFAMLETIREYGLECLTEDSRLDTVQRAHARLMCVQAESHVVAIDHDNHRAALEWALTNDTDLAVRLGASLWWFWYIQGHYGEGIRWLGSVLALDSDDQVSRCRAITGAGAMAFLTCDYEGATELLDAAIDLARATGDRTSLAQALQFRGSIARERGEYDHAIDLHQLAQTIWIELDDRGNAGRSMNYIAFALWLKRDFARAIDLCRMTLPLFRDRGDTDGVAWALLSLAATALHSGDLDRAEQRLEESLSWSRAGGFKEGIAWSLNLLGYVLRARGDNARATAMHQDSLQLHWDLGDRWRSSSVIEALAGLAVDRGELAKAARLFGAAEALRHKHGTPVPPVEMAQYEKDANAARVEEAAWDLGIETPVEETVALAMEGRG